ncbi:DUF4406 domain-containing protein [Oceanispirochaeta sp.]|jgi:hypothetical protein|uniref:DUF4406 domain-containing protein n=1 Tax=Oceanispirochaeta sp. TaxID=2035350 RepID=UPI00263300F9|nr:DUF4406 domain-containing protein [Oceanispirochaeta sp.]MDA3958393.1 DUF4406 domain-containing protein [Oceanispirochaeta sp.]
MKTIYISGPMTGIKDFNREAFMKAEKELLSDYIVINPVRIASALRVEFLLKESDPPEWSDYIRADTKALMDADCIYMLKGWQGSKGADLERYIALCLGLEMKYQ